MPSIRYLMVRSAKGASRTTHDGFAAPGFRPEANSFTCSFAEITKLLCLFDPGLYFHSFTLVAPGFPPCTRRNPKLSVSSTEASTPS
jgi:hypothetical protein